MTAPVLSAAAATCGVPDPAVVADRIAALPVDQLATCAQIAAAAAVALYQGARAAQSAAAGTRAAWSTGDSAVTAIGQTGMAAMAARATMDTYSGAIGGARATMAQLQFQSRAVVSESEAALLALGFDATTGKVPGKTTHLAYPLSDPAGTTVDTTPAAVLPAVTAARDRLDSLQARLESALHELALATRIDPRDMLQRLPALPPAADVTTPGPGLADVAGQGFDLLTNAVALTVGTLGAAVGSALAGGAAGAGAPAGTALADAVRGAASALGGAVQSAVNAFDTVAVEAPSTAAQADTAARARLEADRSSPIPVTRDRAEAIHHALEQAAASGETVHLLTYTAATATEQGTAAIAVGDMGTADTVTTMVPGVMNSPDDMSGALGQAAQLRAEAHRRSPGQSSAVVAWFGYDIPLTSGHTPDRIGNSLSAGDDEAAVAGGAKLAADLSRFRSYAPDTARQVVIGHSMGSVVASAAAAQGATIDDLILLGSPGASTLADSTRDYPNVAAGHTWVVALDDPVTRPEADLLAAVAHAGKRLPDANSLNPIRKAQYIGTSIKDLFSSPLGTDPADADFGARVVDAHGSRPEHSLADWLFQASRYVRAPGALPLTALVANEIDDGMNHSSGVYLSGTALTAIADIAVGHAADAPTKPGR